MTTSISELSEWRKRMEVRWDRARALFGGTDEMRKRHVTYLPRFPAESADSYDYRLNLAVLNNFYRRMSRTMMGYLFHADMQVEDSRLPDDFLENVDQQSRDVNQFAKLLAWNMLTRGIGLHLVDHPIVPPGLTLAEERARGARPYWRSILPDATVAALPKEVSGVETLGHIRWEEKTMTADGWDETCVERIRVYDSLGVGRKETIISAKAKNVEAPANYEEAPVVWSLWRKESNDYVLEGLGVVDLESLNVVVSYTEREAFMIVRPPLDDVAYKNIQHWRKSADLDHILELAAYPTQYQIGTSAPVPTVGPSVILHSDSGESKFGYIEPAGTGIAANERALDRIVAEAEALGIQLLKPTGPASQTATGRVLDETKSTSPLQDMASALEDGITSALEITAQWYGLAQGAGGKAKMDKNFGIDPDMLKRSEVLLKMRAQGDISLETFLKEQQEIGILPKDLDLDEEQARIEDEATRMPPAVDPLANVGDGNQPPDNSGTQENDNGPQ